VRGAAPRYHPPAGPPPLAAAGGKPVSLSYHQNVFDLLDLEPKVSPEALRDIEECERRAGKRLPAALRDWYSLDGIVHRKFTGPLDWDSEFGYLWRDYSNEDHPAPLAEVLEAFTRTDRSGASDRRQDVPVMTENQGCCTWSVRLDGSD